MINKRSLHDIWAKFVPLNPDGHFIHCYSKQDQVKKYEVNGKWRIYKKSLGDTWIINFSELPIKVESSWLRRNEEKQLFGGERIAFPQENEEINDRFDYVFCLTNLQSQNSLKRNREDENLESPPEKLIKIGQAVQEEVICPICLEIFSKCATLSPCGHNFCGLCLIEHLRNSLQCPLCKTPIISVLKHSAFHNIIEAAAMENSPNKSTSNETIVTLQKHLEGHISINRDQIFIGSAVNGMPEGHGTLIFPHKEVYQGIWINGKREGEGVVIFRNEFISSTFWSNNVMQPLIEIKYANGGWYKGDVNGLESYGKGIFKYQNGDIYQGDFKEGLPEGFGKYTWKEGNEYEGCSIQGVPDGFGMLKSSDGNIYEGFWKAGFREGKGVLTFKDGSQYDGYWVNDKFHGSGKYTCKKDGKIYREIWEHGVLKYSSRFYEKIREVLKNQKNKKSEY